MRGADAGALFRAPGIFSSLPMSSHVVTSRDIADSLYNLHHCAGAERHPYEKTAAMVDEIERIVKAGAGRKFIYAYWPKYDRTAHRYGCESREAAARHAEIDEAFGELAARLAATDTIVVATADHGFVDVSPAEALELPSSLAAMLRFPLSGERRVAYCHVHARSEFVQRARDWLGERGEVRESARLAAQGWFGGGTPHPRFDERIGDVTLVMNGHYTVKDWVPGDPRHVHIGNHGGVTEDEMLVPLIVERT